MCEREYIVGCYVCVCFRNFQLLLDYGILIYLLRLEGGQVTHDSPPHRSDTCRVSHTGAFHEERHLRHHGGALLSASRFDLIFWGKLRPWRLSSFTEAILLRGADSGRSLLMDRFFLLSWRSWMFLEDSSGRIPFCIG